MHAIVHVSGTAVAQQRHQQLVVLTSRCVLTRPGVQQVSCCAADFNVGGRQKVGDGTKAGGISWRDTPGAGCVRRQLQGVVW